jgi:serine/threonine protein kinase/tetratricopeptide (TPR) repeat protein
MPPDVIPPRLAELDDFVEAYESARAKDSAAELAEFLPALEHPQYLSVLRELIRIELECGWQAGNPKPLESYREKFAALFHDPAHLEAVAFEEYRQRCQAGEQPSAAEYRQRYAVATDAWPSPVDDSGSRREGMEQAARAYQESRRRHDCRGGGDGRFPHMGPSRLFQDLHASNAHVAERLAAALTSMPHVGTEFLGFRLLAQLGRGAFGRVFLAQQMGLADRPVALKVSADIFHAEPRTLARLQHTNIVPIYSIHQSPPFLAVCMPYFGSITLAHVLKELAGRDALPQSGKGLVSSLDVCRSATHLDLQTSESAARDSEGKQQDRELASANSGSSLTLKMLAGMSYVEAVLWIGSRLADGLAHAHERGILHRDLKPANVLLTDDGQPMLLDFNLSADAANPGGASAAVIGGTLPYMAPEHLEAYRGAGNPVDERGDLYALGVILYELLTGKLPFPARRGQPADVVTSMIADRQAPPPRLDSRDRAVTPAVEAIVSRLLDKDPTRRYGSARALQEDLERHLKHEPLKHQPEPSLRERLRKWRRRHPRLAAGIAMLVIVAFLAAGVSAVLDIRERNRKRDDETALKLLIAETQARRTAFRDELRQMQYLVYLKNVEPDQLAEAIRVGESALKRYGVLEDAGWQEQSTFQSLPADDQNRLLEDVGEALALLAQARLLQSVYPMDPARRTELIREALRLNERARTCYPDEATPRSLLAQQAEATRLLGRADEADQLQKRAEDTPHRIARDYYLSAVESLSRQRYAEALPLLRHANKLDPKQFWVWMLMGRCHYYLGQDGDALSCYSACVSLEPRFPWVYFSRGIVELRARMHARAIADFDKTIELQPDLADAYLHRAMSHQHLKEYAPAVADVQKALQLGSPPLRCRFLLADLRESLGDHAGALRERQEALGQKPSEADSWVARGLARIQADPKGALDDFNHALEINPRYPQALQNKINVLQERLGRGKEALEVLNFAIEISPDSVDLLGGRGIQLARMGQREAAQKDAEACLRLHNHPFTQYQVAGIYALTSKTHPADRKKALGLLFEAFKGGSGFEYLENDPDLEPIRNAPEFQTLVEAARILK